MPQKRGANTDPDVRQAIEDLARSGYRAPGIVAKLKQDRHLRARVPQSLRTIQAIAAGAGRRSTDGLTTWRLEAATADDAALVLPVLAAAIEFSAGRITFLTEDEAEAAATIVRAAPDIPPTEARRLLWLLLQPDKRRGVEHFLAFGPWRNPESAERYLAAWKAGWIDDYIYPRIHLTMRRSAAESKALRIALEEDHS